MSVCVDRGRSVFRDEEADLMYGVRKLVGDLHELLTDLVHVLDARVARGFAEGPGPHSAAELGLVYACRDKVEAYQGAVQAWVGSRVVELSELEDVLVFLHVLSLGDRDEAVQPHMVLYARVCVETIVWAGLADPAGFGQAYARGFPQALVEAGLHTTDAADKFYAFVDMEHARFMAEAAGSLTGRRVGFLTADVQAVLEPRPGYAVVPSWFDVLSWSEDHLVCGPRGEVLPDGAAIMIDEQDVELLRGCFRFVDGQIMCSFRAAASVHTVGEGLLVPFSSVDLLVEVGATRMPADLFRAAFLAVNSEALVECEGYCYMRALPADRLVDVVERCGAFPTVASLFSVCPEAFGGTQLAACELKGDVLHVQSHGSLPVGLPAACRLGGAGFLPVPSAHVMTGGVDTVVATFVRTRGEYADGVNVQYREAGGGVTTVFRASEHSGCDHGQGCMLSGCAGVGPVGSSVLLLDFEQRRVYVVREHAFTAAAFTTRVIAAAHVLSCTDMPAGRDVRELADMYMCTAGVFTSAASCVPAAARPLWACYKGGRLYFAVSSRGDDALVEGALDLADQFRAVVRVGRKWSSERAVSLYSGAWYGTGSGRFEDLQDHLGCGCRDDLTGMRRLLQHLGVGAECVLLVDFVARSFYGVRRDAVERAVLVNGLVFPGEILARTELGANCSPELLLEWMACAPGAFSHARRSGAPVGGNVFWALLDDAELTVGLSDCRYGVPFREPATRGWPGVLFSWRG